METKLWVRNATVFLMLACFASIFFTSVGLLDYIWSIMGVLGLVVVLLTIRLHETLARRIFFILTGVAGIGFLVTIGVFSLMSLCGHKPGGDGGGITVAMLIIILPAMFLIGAIGSIVLLVKGQGNQGQNLL